MGVVASELFHCIPPCSYYLLKVLSPEIRASNSSRTQRAKSLIWLLALSRRSSRTNGFSALRGLALISTSVLVIGPVYLAMGTNVPFLVRVSG